MQFEFLPDELGFMNRFAARLNVPIIEETLTIPDSVGNGQVKYIDLPPDFKLVLHTYTLKEELIIKRLAPEEPEDVINFLFNINQDLTAASAVTDPKNALTRSELAIRIISHDLASDIRFPPNSLINYVVISVRRHTLAELLTIESSNTVVQTILAEKSSFLFYERISPPFLRILKQLTNGELVPPMRSLQYRIRVYELIYLVFDRLLQRATRQHSPINKADVDQIFLVRDDMLADLSRPPSLKYLSGRYGLSVTKMAGLFNQVFGTTIYNYYQTVRMEKAASLLKTGAFSVSETGYQLGFANLSHFTRVFEKHYGVKPKKFSAGVYSG